ncbi:hypothetical protein PQO03_06070 [Lentisphaera profundi]|uniref:DUF4198 domain-containing protein n=1 Tax=Lentisphaera profundi TaxID=1658616 RepID=A0ABY7VMN6_9BACT|nr:hypothetical protein [Lentisphaera profundi]WDE95285.1 hypothetical protein PQO03_06070 [Lentisphaera profundi]
MKLKYLSTLLLLSQGLFAQVASNVSLYSNVKGDLAISSEAFNQGKAACSIDLAGQGKLQANQVGSKGYVIFRYQAKDWWDAHEPHFNVGLPFEFIKETNEKTVRKDRLHDSLKKRELNLTVDGQEAGSPNQAGNLWKANKEIAAYWDFKVTNEMPNLITVVTAKAGVGELAIAPLDDPKNKQIITSIKEEQGACIIQFNAKGNFRLYLQQRAYADKEEQKKRPAANISVIFLDEKAQKKEIKTISI